MKKGIIFDMDGTLWDSAPEVVESWNEVIRQSGYERESLTTEDMQSVMGKTMDVIADILFADLPKEKRMELLDRCGEHENEYLRKHGGTLYPKLRETLEALKRKYHLYIVSNCQVGYIEAFMEYHNLEKYFDDIEMAGRTGVSKGENIKLIMDRNHIDKAVYVGDTMGDYEAASYAGVPFIYAKYGFGTVDEAKYVAKDIGDIPSLVNTI